jgi:hypothetical protein
MSDTAIQTVAFVALVLAFLLMVGSAGGGFGDDE